MKDRTVKDEQLGRPVNHDGGGEKTQVPERHLMMNTRRKILTSVAIIVTVIEAEI
jgi:hypothetical protein